jgi:hypothetical protein
VSEGQDVSLLVWLRDVITSGPIISGLVGLITGAIGSLIAPWVQWGVEKRRHRREARRERIAAWRAAVDRDDFEPRQFAGSDAYATLRAYLPEDLRQEIDGWRNPTMFVAPPRAGRYPIQGRLLQEIARIERKWGLI